MPAKATRGTLNVMFDKLLNKEQIKEYVSKLDEKGLEEFLKKNKIQYTDSGISQAPAEEEVGEVLLWILKAVMFAILIIGLYFIGKRVGII